MKKTSIATMVATTALITLPVLAQTSGSGPAAPASPGMSATTRPGGGTATTNAAPAPSTPKYFTADHQVRVSKVVGATVYNDQDQSIGSVDDVLMGDSDHKAGTAVIAVGGFLGMGSKLVSVPFDQLKIQNDKIVMSGATKASLEGMPDYHYTSA